jgi:3-oxoadipate enol-lactonase
MNLKDSSTSTPHVKAFAEVNDTRLYYEISGSGPPIVLINGYTLDTRMWDDQMAALTAGYRVVRYDIRGFGKSAVLTGEPYSYHQDLKALLDYLGIHCAHIMGQSLGGAIAVDFAIAYPEAVDALILIDVSGLSGYFWPDTLNEWFRSIFTAARNGNLELAKEHWLNTDWFKPARRNSSVGACLKRMVDEFSGWHFQHDNPVVSLEPVANERLGEIKAPTLIILGELDLPFYNHPLADRLHQGIANSKKIILSEVGHMANMEAPEKVNQLVLSFLASLNSVNEERTTWLAVKHRETIELYDTRWAPEYGEKWGLYSNASHMQYIAKFLSHLPPASSILDAACGAGRYMPFLLEKGHTVFGIDQSQGMLARARLYHPEVHTEKLGLQEMKFYQKFDGAICMDALEHNFPEDWPVILNNFHQALKPGGTLYFTVEMADPVEVEQAYIHDRQPKLPVVYGEMMDGEVYHYYPLLEQVRDWLQQAGLEILEEADGDGYHHMLTKTAANQG